MTALLEEPTLMIAASAQEKLLRVADRYRRPFMQMLLEPVAVVRATIDVATLEMLFQMGNPAAIITYLERIAAGLDAPFRIAAKTKASTMILEINAAAGNATRCEFGPQVPAANVATESYTASPAVDAAVKTRVDDLIAKMNKDGTFAASKVRLQNGPIVASKVIKSDTATGFVYKEAIKGWKTPYSSNPGGIKNEILLRVDAYKAGLKTPEATLLHENGHVIDFTHNISADAAVKAAWEKEGAAYLARHVDPGDGTMGIKYYARKLNETVAQGISQIHAERYVVQVWRGDEFEAAFPDTIKALRAALKKAGL